MLREYKFAQALHFFYFFLMVRCHVGTAAAHVTVRMTLLIVTLLRVALLGRGASALRRGRRLSLYALSLSLALLVVLLLTLLVVALRWRCTAR